MLFNVVVDDEIRLCLVHERHVTRFAELVAECYDYLAFRMEWPRHCKTHDDFKAYIKSSLHDYADGKSMVCAIEYRGEVVGSIGYNTIKPNLKKVEIGYWLAEKYQGNGIMTRSCRFLIEYAFSELGMEKVQISAAEGNAGSRAVCERLGLRLEGIISNNEKVGEQVLAHAVYGIHKSKVD